MKFLKLSLAQRLLLSLGLSFSIVISVALMEWGRNQVWPSDSGFAFIAIAVLAFLTLSTINQYIKEASIGWKRLSLTSSFVIGLGVCLYIYFGDILQGDDFFLSLLSFPILFSIVLYSKVLYLWVKDGFERDKI